MPIEPQSMVAVIGAGTMGSGIAEVAARHGHPVTIIDAQPDALARSKAGLEASLDAQVQKGRLAPDMRDAIVARLTWDSDLSAAAKAGLVIEAIVENRDAKTALFAALETIVGPDAVLATNTSSLSITILASAIARPTRFIGLHFFNPVPAMKLVEIIPSGDTAQPVIEDCVALMSAWGKLPALVRDVPGFIVNRVARPYYAEAFAAWRDGMDPVAIDALLVTAGGFRMGPLALADLIGHDTNYAVAALVHQGYGDKAKFALQPNQRALVEAGRLGRKSGVGVHDYCRDLPEPTMIAPVGTVEAIVVSAASQGLEPLLDRLSQTGVRLDIESALGSDQLRLPGGAILALSDGRRLAGRKDCVMLLDVARDLRTTTLMGLAFDDAGAAAETAALFANAGIGLIAIPDRPGLLIQRTFAQLANAAADALDDQVAGAGDIGFAMQFGANHPESPLDWAQRVGHEPVASWLSAIAADTGDAMYEPSPWLTSLRPYSGGGE